MTWMRASPAPLDDLYSEHPSVLTTERAVVARRFLHLSRAFAELTRASPTHNPSVWDSEYMRAGDNPQRAAGRQGGAPRC